MTFFKSGHDSKSYSDYDNHVYFCRNLKEVLPRYFLKPPKHFFMPPMHFLMGSSRFHMPLTCFQMLPGHLTC